MDSILYKTNLDRIYRILRTLIFISFQMKEINFNPLRGMSLKKNLARYLFVLPSNPINPINSINQSAHKHFHRYFTNQPGAVFSDQKNAFDAGREFVFVDEFWLQCEGHSRFQLMIPVPGHNIGLD